MVTLKNNSILLRALEPEDLSFLYDIENNELLWEVSQTQAPYSKFLLKQYLDNSHKDIYEVKQLRLVIMSLDNERLGLIDLFDFDPKNKKIGVGLVVVENERHKKIGFQALELLIDYVFKNLQVHQIYAHILEDNIPSIKLFKKLGFSKTTIKKDWVFNGSQYKDEYLFQLIKDVH